MSRRASQLCLIALLSSLSPAGSAWAAAQPTRPALIPLPVRLTQSDGTFALGAETPIQVAKSEEDTARILADAIARSTGIHARILAESAPNPIDGAINLCLDAANSGLGAEGYRLEITPKRVTITAARSTGLFYGMQTLRQLLPLRPVEGGRDYPLPCLDIEDEPRFGWRGFMLDSSRHFVKKTTILSLLDALALCKINVFHWHLVDDEAWRLAIAKYPQLTRPADISRPEYAQAMGFYTAADVGEIVDRAKRLHIMIVPEIEMPGHAMQAACVLEEASCLGADGKPVPPGSTREICLGSDKTIQQFQDILVETMALFPNSPYIHLGGDEANDRRWKACSRCQARMAELGITDPRRLQKWFMDKMNRFVREHGHTSVAWADRLSLGIPEGQIVHGWHAGELEEAVAKGFLAINSQHEYTYFDYSQGPGDTTWADMSLHTTGVYALDPTRGLSSAQAKLVLGTQAQLWTEHASDEHVFEKTFPRILALAEVGWTPQEKRDGTEFARRLRDFLPRLDALGIAYFAPAVQLGAWAPQDMSESWKDLEWNVTTAIRKTGSVVVQMLYQRGEHALSLQSITLLEDGREISRDEHRGSTGGTHVKNDYRLQIGAVKPGATYTLRAHIRSDGGTDSHGIVLLH